MRLNSEGGSTPSGVPTRTLSPEWGGLGGFHIDWRGERVPAKTLGLKEGGGGGWVMRSHIDWREERNILYKGMEISP